MTCWLCRAVDRRRSTGFPLATASTQCVGSAPCAACDPPQEDVAPGEWAEVDLDDGDNRLTVRNRLEAAAQRRGLHLALRRSSGIIVRFAIEAALPTPVEQALPAAPEPEPQLAPKKRGRKPAAATA